uniref:Putative secreted protein n=1 Tax=Anopheles darlingi TaxID=43151 RepID=A0A2M4DJK1_ANODA
MPTTGLSFISASEATFCLCTSNCLASTAASTATNTTTNHNCIAPLLPPLALIVIIGNDVMTMFCTSDLAQAPTDTASSNRI